MNYLAELKARFQPVLEKLVADDPAPLLEMIRPAQDPKLGDFQANFAMPLCKQIGRGSEGPQVAQEIVDQTDFDGLCEQVEVAGPGFINMRIASERLNEDINSIVNDPRLGVPVTNDPKTIVIDFSSPNIAKPMHVGHIRSTVIGDSLSRTLRFMGHTVITDNHIGDWGTQFGMILYGYKHFLDESGFEIAPVNELSRLYRLVNQLVTYYKDKDSLPEAQEELDKQLKLLEAANADEDDSKKAKKKRKQLQKKVDSLEKGIKSLKQKIAKVDEDPNLSVIAAAHPKISEAVLQETAKLHDGDPQNRALWEEFLPSCRDEMQKIYKRLNVEFDFELGESFYHDQLADVVERFKDQGYAVKSEGAMCVFLDGFKTPMIIQKKDGAYLYATTDLATIDYRVHRWNPDEILYVVDFRQSEHFEKLFAAAALTNQDTKLVHVKFGTVTDKKGKPFKTRDGAVGLEWLLDLAVQGALKVLNESQRAPEGDEEIESIQQKAIAETVGHAAVKYFDLLHNRESDYEFDQKRMVANEGNTATYMQYSYARISSIVRKSGVDMEELRESGKIKLVEPEERTLALEVLQLEHVIAESLVDYRPNILTAYVYNLAVKFSSFFEAERCHVNNAKEPTKSSRLLLLDVVGRTIEKVLSMLGIEVVKRM